MRKDLTAARDEHIRHLSGSGVSLYPTWPVHHGLGEGGRGRTHVAKEIGDDADALITKGQPVTIAGRLLGVRRHGGSTFIDIVDRSGKIQALARKDTVGDKDYKLLESLDRGDIISVTGSVIRTKAGEVTVDATTWLLLTKSHTPLPDTWYGLHDVERRARQRELDLLVNEETRRAFDARSTLIRSLREFLVARDFVEVETPVLQPIPGGTSARPFNTHHNALDLELTLRISPELYLKRLVVGGMERVFEVARNFRNEGVDRQHNPEFTMCELYMAYATVEDLIPLTEELVTHLLAVTRGGATFSYQGKEISFARPWKQLSFVEAMRSATGIDPSKETDLTVYEAVFKKHDWAFPEIRTLPALIDELYKQVIRTTIWDPVIVRDFPTVMEPLAKRHDDNPDLVQRIQVIAAGMELIKAYTELNDPDDQEKRFHEQEAFRASGDEEAQRIDHAFLDALRIGLPPTAGWGMGIDRLVMIATDRPHIRDVIAFPLMRPTEGEENA